MSRLHALITAKGGCPLRRLHLTLAVSFAMGSGAMCQERNEPGTSAANGAHLFFSMPYVNNFIIHTPTGKRTATGFLGLSAGAEVPLGGEEFLSFQVGGAATTALPLPVPVDYSPDRDMYASAFANACCNERFGRFSCGGGVHYSSLTWYHSSFKTHVTGTGPVVRGQYEVWKNFSAGCFYQATIFSTGSGSSWAYQHLLSLELIWSFDV